MLSESVKIVEVGPRDGLQNLHKIIPTPIKLELIRRLVACGLKHIEATSFVHPKWVPQMADAKEVMQGLDLGKGVNFPVLTPNLMGLKRAQEVGVKEVEIFGAASEAFSQKNINCSIAESLTRFKEVCQSALAQGIRVRGYISTVLGCPYQGKVEVASVVQMAEAMIEMGCYEISLGDTIGIGTPRHAREVLHAVSMSVPLNRLAVHFHDTYGQALANIYACMELGVKVIDSSVGGLGGCPYAQGAAGNVATEDVVYMLEGMGVTTGLSLSRLIETGDYITSTLGQPNRSRVGLARKTSISACQDAVG